MFWDTMLRIMIELLVIVFVGVVLYAGLKKKIDELLKKKGDKK